MKRLLFAGYFGCGNLGDDAILLGFLSAIEKGPQSFEYFVLCESPEYLRRQYNLNGIARMDRSASQAAINNCDAVIFPGGSIFQDVTSLRSVAYYADIVKRAKKAGKPVYLLNQGVGPLTSFFGKRMAADAFRSAEHVTVRDPASQATLQSLGVNKTIGPGGDSAFLLPLPHFEGDDTQFGLLGRKTIALIPRPVGDEKKLAKLFADVCKLLMERQMTVTLIEMDEKIDGVFIDLIEKAAGGRLSHIKNLGSPIKIQQRLHRMDGVISLRLHGSILAATIGKAPYILSYDPKTVAIAKQLDLPAPLPIESATPQRIVEGFLAFQEKRELHDRLVTKKAKELAANAEKSVSLVLRTFEPVKAI